MSCREVSGEGSSCNGSDICHNTGGSLFQKAGQLWIDLHYLSNCDCNLQFSRESSTLQHRNMRLDIYIGPLQGIFSGCALCTLLTMIRECFSTIYDGER